MIAYFLNFIFWIYESLISFMLMMIIYKCGDIEILLICRIIIILQSFIANILLSAVNNMYKLYLLIYTLKFLFYLYTGMNDCICLINNKFSYFSSNVIFFKVRYFWIYRNIFKYLFVLYQSKTNYGLLVGRLNLLFPTTTVCLPLMWKHYSGSKYECIDFIFDYLMLIIS